MLRKWNAKAVLYIVIIWIRDVSNKDAYRKNLLARGMIIETKYFRLIYNFMGILLIFKPIKNILFFWDHGMHPPNIPTLDSHEDDCKLQTAMQPHSSRFDCLKFPSDSKTVSQNRKSSFFNLFILDGFYTLTVNMDQKIPEKQQLRVCKIWC